MMTMIFDHLILFIDMHVVIYVGMHCNGEKKIERKKNRGDIILGNHS